MRIVVTGSSGLIGQALVSRLRQAGHQVVPLVRRAPGPGEAAWDPVAGTIDPRALPGAGAVVHLAGAGIADRRWSPARRRQILDSRVRSTDLLARTLAVGAAEGSPVLISGSAVGWYGDRGDEELTETSGAGGGFLADVCRRWEEATGPAEAAGLRVAHLRTGIVLSRHGGALARQLPLFRLGLGATLGSGRQWVSWISLDDEVGAIEHVIATDGLVGPVNATAPEPVTNRVLTRQLGRTLHRPALLRMPPLALRLALGAQLADEALLGGQRVLPAALEHHGYRFRHPTLPGALAAALG
jgi:hypothetical protein